MSPRSTATGYDANARPVAAMLAGHSVAVLSITSPLAGFVVQKVAERLALELIQRGIDDRHVLAFPASTIRAVTSGASLTR